MDASCHQQEKLIKLHETTIGKVKIDACRLRASHLCGLDLLDEIPKDLYVKNRTDLDQVTCSLYFHVLLPGGLC